jgi:hypothetical protein
MEVEPMTVVAVEHLVYLLDEAFEGEDWHSLLGNVRSVTPGHWLWVPPGGSRSIRDIIGHVGSCKLMYENHAFGDASLSWEHPLVSGVDVLGDAASAVAWLREGHARLRGSVASLGDADLVQARRTNWGEMKETRWIIATMIQHDLYHAGEINHIRALACGDDA